MQWYRNITSRYARYLSIMNSLWGIFCICVIFAMVGIIGYWIGQPQFFYAVTQSSPVILDVSSDGDTYYPNVIISGDVFDSQYMFNPVFHTVYIKRRFHHFGVASNIPDTVNSIVKDESPFDLAIFNSEMYFKLLLSIKGSKIRNIKSAKGFGYGRFMALLKEGLNNGVVLKDFSSIGSITDLFPSKYREDIINAFQCTNIDTQITMTTESDIELMRTQMVDKSDIESVQALNNKRFLQYPLKLIYLV